MNATAENSAINRSRSLKLLGLVILILILVVPASNAQNTKGDKPATTRESRFKTPFQKRSPKRKATGKKRVRSKEKSVAGRARVSKPRRASGNDLPGKPIRPIAKSKPSTKQRAWTGDIAGRRIRTKSPAGKSRYNVYPQRGRYVHNPSSKPRRTEHAVSNRGELAVLKGMQSKYKPSDDKRRKVVPRSASRSYTARKSINVYASFPRQKRKGERATTKDLAGRRLRSRNFESPRPGVIAPTFKPYAGRKKRGDKPYNGSATGGYRSATRAGQQAWQGDLAGRRLRGRNFSSKKSIEGQPILPSRKNKDRDGHRPSRVKGGWHVTATRSGERTGIRPFQGRAPGIRADGIRKRPSRVKGGWHVTATQSGEKRPGIRPLPGKAPGIGADGIGKFQGGIKTRRAYKGGGSVSGKTWNNREQAIAVRTSGQGGRAALFQGNIKTKRPLKGGGSVSGKLWNNDRQAIAVRTPKQGGRAALFQGNIKSRRPLKGGGSVSGKLWNNNGQAIAVRAPKQGGQVALFQGNIKGKRPEKGGGSVSGKLWNNNQTPIEGRVPPSEAGRIGGYPGKMKRFEVQPGFSDQGETFTGYVKLKKFKRNYFKKPHAAEDALPGVKPNKSSVKASEYARSVRRTWDYIHNPSSSEEALKTREPGRAFALSSAYQGNVKMQKFNLFEKNRGLHPDTKFIKTNKNNVDGERDVLTNVKLWWARLFKKQETQPEHLKYKGEKPRYDKGEDGMWNN